LQLFLLHLGFIAIVSEPFVELFLELFLQVEKRLLAHHLYFRSYSLVQHALALERLGRERTFGSFFVFTI
jgi:hypothetical protein